MYTTIAQKGEMSWGQPYYGIAPTEEELTKLVPPDFPTGSPRLLIHSETVEHTSHNVTTGEIRTSTNTRHWYVPCSASHNNELLCSIKCFKDLAVYANYFGERMDASFYERYNNILVKVPS